MLHEREAQVVFLNATRHPYDCCPRLVQEAMHERVVALAKSVEKGVDARPTRVTLTQARFGNCHLNIDRHENRETYSRSASVSFIGWAAVCTMGLALNADRC
jgi:hypothetical protein